jgi:hypothetical protein
VTLTCPNCGRSKVSDSIGHRHTGAQCFWCGFSTDRNDSAATPHPPKETYLGDGLYASFDGFMVTLRAPRPDGDHWVGLEPDVLGAFIGYLQKIGCRFTIPGETDP